MSDQLTDEVLARAQSGHAGAIRVLYERLSPSILGYLRAKGVTDPEGVTSEVFLTVLPKLRSIEGGAAGLRRFAFSVAHARMVDDHRRQHRQPDTVLYLPELDERTVRSAEQEALQAHGERDVTGLLATLPADQAEVLALRIIGDLTVEQVGQVMGRSPGAIKQLQRRGLLTLRQRLGEREVTL